MILERGALLNQRYRIVEILGQGGMGSVYRAVDENLGVEVAVKDNLFTTDEYARQFRREASILANLRHPNLPRVTDHFVMEGQGQYLVMDFIEGEDLRQRMDRVGVLSDTEAIVIGSAVCDALSYLHSRNPAIVHRDLKPGNVKITPHGQIFLVDFGLAKVVQGSQVTTTGARAMTPGYSPPEQYGTARTDHRSDIFSLGATLYAALTGAIPEDSLSRAMEQAELTPIRKHNPRVSRRLAAIIEKSLEVRPDDRYQTADEFKQALRGALSTTRRRALDSRVAPPPELEDRPLPAGGILPVTPAGSRPVTANRSPLPIAIHAPMEEPESAAPKPKQRRRARAVGCWPAVVLGALMLGGSLGALVFGRSFPPLALAWLLQTPPAITSTSPPGETPPASPQPSPTATVTRTRSIALGPRVTSTTRPTLAPTVTETPPPTFTPLPTSVGGGTGQIAFAYDKTGVPQIYIINVDGTELTKITDVPEGACQPEWSPDGQILVFISPCESNQDLYRGSTLYLINADGTGMTQLLPATLWGDFDPAWSPDGRKIAFTTMRDGGRPRIYVYNLETKSVAPLSDPDDPYSRDKQPAWAPDGQKIAFITNRRGPQQIWVMDADGRNQELFSHSVDKVNEHPTWSPDGSMILYNQRDKIGGIPRLMAAAYPIVEVFTEFMLNPERVPMQDARYSPDGLWIALEAWPEANHNIYVMSAGGAGRRAITTEPRVDFDPVWRPSGQ